MANRITAVRLRWANKQTAQLHDIINHLGRKRTRVSRKPSNSPTDGKMECRFFRRWSKQRITEMNVYDGVY